MLKVGNQVWTIARRVAVAGLALSLLVPRAARAQSDQLAAARSDAAAHPDEPAAGLRLGRVLRRAGVFQAASAELRKAAAMSAARATPLALQIQRELALIAIDQDNYDQAMRACRAIAALPDGRALSHACVAEAFMIRKRATEALPEVASALRLSPNLYEAKVVEGYARWQSAEEAAAEAAFRAAADAQPHRSEAFVGLGRLLAALGRKADAQSAFERAHAADPADPVSAYALGESLGPTERAVSVLQGAIALRPSLAAAHGRLAQVLLELGRLDQAEQEARLALQSGRPEPAWLATLGAILVKRGQLDAALAQADAALKIVPNLAAAKLVEADARAGKHEIDLAIEAYQVAFGYDRQNPAPLVRAALACLAHERATTAAGFAEKATDTFPSWGPAWDIRGDIAAKAGDNADARRFYERALSSDGPVDKESVRRKLARL